MIAQTHGPNRRGLYNYYLIKYSSLSIQRKEEEFEEEDPPSPGDPADHSLKRKCSRVNRSE